MHAREQIRLRGLETTLGGWEVSQVVDFAQDFANIGQINRVRLKFRSKLKSTILPPRLESCRGACLE